MAPVKFSTMIVTVSAEWLTPITACQANTRFDAICRNAPIHRLVVKRKGARHETAGESADQASPRSPTPLTIAA